jgi:omega-6 fatty acid desaturase (delta-12 desaturase)
LSRITRPYRGGNLRASLFQLSNTFIPLGALYWAAVHWTSSAPLLCAPAAVVCAGLVVRAFDLQHDCSHRSFFRSRLANDVTGFLIGILTLTPHACWRRFHNAHHAGSGNLDKRGIGDIRTLTVAEYLASTPLQRFCYRFYRHPLTLFGLGAFLFFAMRQRLTYYIPKDWKRERLSVHATNATLMLVAAAVYAAAENPMAIALFHGAVMLLATGFGVWLYYIQHQFPAAYWRPDDGWDPDRAALEGSSFYDLPRVLHWFTANIGYHHIHHVDVNVPNYRLPALHAAGHPELEPRARFTLLASLAYARLKLWDEERQAMVGFRGLAARRAAGTR